MLSSVCANGLFYAAVDKIRISDNDVDIGRRSVDADLGSERDHERFGGCVRDHVVWAVPLRNRVDDTLYIGEGIGIE